MVPVKSPLVVSYLPPLCQTSYLAPYSRYLMPKSCDLIRTVQCHPKSKVTVLIDSPWVVSYSTSINRIIVSMFSKYLTCNFNDLELERFKVTLDQRSWCQSKAHGWFPTIPSVYLHYLGVISIEIRMESDVFNKSNEIRSVKQKQCWENGTLWHLA